MTTAITTTTNHHLHSDALPLVDLRLLSHSDLLTLSLSSSTSLSLKNDADLSTPKIDRSVFNESAGSRKQTFSRLRLAPPRNYYSQFASNSNSSIPNRNESQNQTNVIGKESSEIVSLLKSFFGGQNEDVEENYENALPSFSVPVAIPLQYSDVPYSKKSEDLNVIVRSESGAKKRKRGRPRRDERNVGVVGGSGGIVVCKDVKKEDKDVKVGEEGGEGKNARLESGEDVNVKVSEEGGEGENARLESTEDGNVKVSKEGGEEENARLVSPEDVNVKVSEEGGDGGKALLSSVDDVNVKVSNEGGEGGNALLVSADGVNVNVHVSVPTELGTKKRKRGRPRKNERNVRIEKKVIVSCREMENARVEDPYEEELRRKTEGMQTKGELVGYLEGVEGVWIGGRKKSRVVNASEFGCVLPMGWKLMISVKRRACFAWLACKRYIRFLLFFCYVLFVVCLLVSGYIE